MKKLFYILIGVSLAVGATAYAQVTNPFRTWEGGTGSTTPSGILYGDNGASGNLHTATIGAGCTFIGGTLSCNGITTYDAFTHPAVGQSATTSQLNMIGFLSTASSTIVGNATTTGSFSIGTAYIPSLSTSAGSFIAVDPNGQVIATTTPSNTNYWTLSGSKLFNNSGTNAGIGTTSPNAILSVNAPAGVPSLLIGSTTKTYLEVDQNGKTTIGFSAIPLFSGIPLVAALTVVGPSSYHANLPGAFEICSDTTVFPKCVQEGYDATNGFGFIQSEFFDNTNEPFIIQPNGGNTSIGFSVGSTPNALLQVDYPNAAQASMGTQSNLWTGVGNASIGSFMGISFGEHTGSVTVGTSFIGAQPVAADLVHHFPEDLVFANRKDGTAYNSAPTEDMRITDAGNVEIGTTTQAYGTNILSNQLLLSSTTGPQLGLENGTNFGSFRMQSDNSLVYSTSSPITGATSTPILSIDSNGVPTYLNSGVVSLSSGTITVSGTFIDSKTIIMLTDQSACVGHTDITATTSTSFTITSSTLTDTCMVGYQLIKHN